MKTKKSGKQSSKKAKAEAPKLTPAKIEYSSTLGLPLHKVVVNNIVEIWEVANEQLAFRNQESLDNLGGIFSNEVVGYNYYIASKTSDLDENLDLGKLLGYRNKKWGALVANYVDKPYLDLVKSEMQARLAKNPRRYNFSFRFSNSHAYGKDCLIALQISKVSYSEKPIAVFITRASEVTKRLIFDLVLVKRILEYLFGKNPDMEVHFFAMNFHITAEAFVLYNNHKPIMPIFKRMEKKGLVLNDFQERIVKTLDSFTKVDINTVKYKVNVRSIRQLQSCPDGEKLSRVPHYRVKDMKLFEDEQLEGFPKDVISLGQRRNHKKNNPKK